MEIFTLIFKLAAGVGLFLYAMYLLEESLPFPVIHVPVLSPEKRVDFILKNI